MPAINLPLHQTQGNVTSNPDSAADQRFIVNLSFAAAGLLVVLALRLATRVRQNRRKSQPSAASLADPGAVGQYHWPSGISTKSRGVSNGITPDMSANHATDLAQLKVDGNLEKRHDGGRNWAQDGTNGSYDERLDSAATIGISVSRNLKSRPPPPPPLTPPKLSAGVFAFEDRRLSAAVSTVGELDPSFFDQPNPDYTSFSDGSSSSTTSALPLSHGSPTTPRRRSYTKVLPLGPPQPVSALELDGTITSFSPSSFPSSSPILPLAPHDSFHQKEIDVHGEIISVMDDSGAGWKRHTRVYGGGVCLACMASGGGFYGEKVRPEERR